MTAKSFSMFLKELFSDWSSGITGAASIPFTVLCLYASGKGQRIGYAVTAAVLFLFSSYRTWLMQYSRANLEQQRADASLAKPRVTSADWQALAEQFKQPHDYARADYTTTDDGTTWHVVGEPQCSALCRRAGAMLRCSPSVFAQMNVPVTTAQDDLSRWLEYLRERFGAESLLYGSDATTGKVTMWSGVVPSLYERSVTACTDFSTALI